jgi:predicted ribosome quality control (RQC) complex YloA/Tae2 family protein
VKYFLLKQVVEYLKENAHIIKLIKRIDNNIIIIEFNNNNTLYFDMTKGQSLIYKKKDRVNTKKDYNAPFDVLLQKRFTNSKIEYVSIYNEDKVINIKVNSSSSYKKLTTILQLEFTGKHTNIIILDEDRVVLEALRHVDELSSSRIVKTGHKLDEIPRQKFQFVQGHEENIEEYLYKVYEIKEQNFLDNLKKQKIVGIQKKLKKLKNLIDSLPQKEKLEEESDVLYKNASIILSNLHNIKPYQKELETIDYEGNQVKIDLQSNMNASTYSNELFKKAKRLKQKALNISIEKSSLMQKYEFLLKMKSNVQKCTNIDELEFLLPKKQKNQTKTVKQQNYENFFFNGYKIMLGRNERENIYLLKNSKASDFWFHLKDRTSCHVIVQNSKKTIPDEVIIKAAQLCAKFSVEFSGNYLVDYTQRRNVKIQSGSNVLYNPYTTIEVDI